MAVSFWLLSAYLGVVEAVSLSLMHDRRDSAAYNDNPATSRWLSKRL